MNHFQLVVNERIAAHISAEQQRQAAERERIRAEEAAKMAQPAQVVATQLHGFMNSPIGKQPVAKAAPSTEPPINLSTIADRLGFNLPAAFIEGELNIKRATMPIKSAAVYFREEDFGAICAALVKHVNNVMEHA